MSYIKRVILEDINGNPSQSVQDSEGNYNTGQI